MVQITIWLNAGQIEIPSGKHSHWHWRRNDHANLCRNDRANLHIETIASCSENFSWVSNTGGYLGTTECGFKCACHKLWLAVHGIFRTHISVWSLMYVTGTMCSLNLKHFDQIDKKKSDHLNSLPYWVSLCVWLCLGWLQRPTLAPPGPAINLGLAWLRWKSRVRK